MKKLLLIASFFISVASYAQLPAPVQRGVAGQPVADARLYTGLNFKIPHYPDTATANTNKGQDSIGALIYTDHDTAVYYRAISAGGAKFWKKFANGTVSVTWGQITGSISSQTDLQDSLNGKQYLIVAPNAADYYWNGFEKFVPLNTDSIAEGFSHLFFTDARARNAISLTTSGSSGPSTYDVLTGILNVPNYAATVDSGVLAGRFITITRGAVNRTVNDTASHLTDFTNDLNLASYGFLPIADTSSMLSPYLRKIDTTGKWVSNVFDAPGLSTDTIYETKGGSNSQVLIVDRSSGLVSGGIVTWSGSGLTFEVSPAVYYINGIRYTSPQTSVTLATADPTNPRQDVIGLNSSGVITITGTPAANPEVPTVDPSTQLFLTSILVPAGATTPSGIGQTVIYDENTEWTGSATGVTVNFANTVTPFHGSKDASVGAFTAGQHFQFVNGSTVDLSTFNALKFYLRLTTAFAATAQLQVSFYNGATLVSSVVSITTGNFGFVRTTTGAYQTITVPMSSFTFTSSTANTLRITFAGANGGFLIDYITLQNGITQVQGSQNALTVLQTPSGAATATQPNDLFTLANGNFVSISASGKTITIADTATHLSDYTNDKGFLATIDTTNIASFSVKVRSLFHAGNFLTYVASTGTYADTATHLSDFTNDIGAGGGLLFGHSDVTATTDRSFDAASNAFHIINLSDLTFSTPSGTKTTFVDSVNNVKAQIYYTNTFGAGTSGTANFGLTGVTNTSWGFNINADSTQAVVAWSNGLGSNDGVILNTTYGFGMADLGGLYSFVIAPSYSAIYDTTGFKMAIVDSANHIHLTDWASLKASLSATTIYTGDGTITASSNREVSIPSSSTLEFSAINGTTDSIAETISNASWSVLWQSQPNAGSQENSFNLTPSDVSMQSIDITSSPNQGGRFTIDAYSAKNGAVYTDFEGTPTGIKYAADYDATFVPTSLVDKEYVDAAIAGGVPTLDQVLTAGNTSTNFMTAQLYQSKPAYTTGAYISALSFSGNGTQAYGVLVLRDSSTGTGAYIQLRTVPTVASNMTLNLYGNDGDTIATRAYARSAGGGGGTITLTGNVTGSGTSSIATTIASGVVTNAMLAGSIDLTAKVTGILPIANGGTNVGSVTTSPTATAFAGWDANKNLSANNYINGYATTATAAGTTTLTVASATLQYFTGSTTQTVALPVASTLSNGLQFVITNSSSGVVTVQTSGANTLQAMAANTQLVATCINTAGGTGTASWNWTYVNIQQTASGVAQITNSDGTLTISPTSGNVVASLALSHANTWTGLQTYQFNSLGTTTTDAILVQNTTASVHSSAQVSPAVSWGTTVFITSASSIPVEMQTSLQGVENVTTGEAARFKTQMVYNGHNSTQPQLNWLMPDSSANLDMAMYWSSGATDYAGISFNNQSGKVKVGAFTSGGYILDFMSNGSEVGQFNTSGHLLVNTTTDDGLLTVNGSFAPLLTATATSLTAGNHYTIKVTATGQTITLPTAVGCNGRIYVIKLTATGSCTVGTTSSQTIDGSTTYSLSAQYKYVSVQSDNANWNIIANN